MVISETFNTFIIVIALNIILWTVIFSVLHYVIKTGVKAGILAAEEEMDENKY